MTERDKIINIVEQNKYCDVNTNANCRECKYSKELENYKDMGCSSLKTADALIAAGFGDVTEYKAEAEYWEKICKFESDEYHTTIKNAAEHARHIMQERDEYKHRAEVAERALLTACANLIKDVEDNINMELLVHVVYTKFLRKAEKELTEEGEQ